MNDDKKTEETTVEKTQVNVPTIASDGNCYEIQITFKGFQVDNEKCSKVIDLVCEELNQVWDGAKVKHDSNVKTLVYKLPEPTIFDGEPGEDSELVHSGVAPY